MAENLMSKDHKATNKNWRDNYDRIFSKREVDIEISTKHFEESIENVETVLKDFGEEIKTRFGECRSDPEGFVEKIKNNTVDDHRFDSLVDEHFWELCDKDKYKCEICGASGYNRPLIDINPSTSVSPKLRCLDHKNIKEK